MSSLWAKLRPPRPDVCCTGTAGTAGAPGALGIQDSCVGVRSTGPKHTAKFWHVIRLLSLNEATRLRWSKSSVRVACGESER